MDVVEGKCFVSGRFEQCCIGIEDGRIVKVAKVLDGDRIYRFGSKAVLPGAIDVHVHFREPGMTHKEDFETGSLAALHAGVTCVLDMPNTNPPSTTLATIREKRRLASSKSLADFGLFAGVRPGIDVQGLAKEAVGFKLYMASTTGELLVSALDQVKGELAEIAGSGKVLAVHAEDEKLRRKEPERSLEDHLKNRQNECETSAIRKVKEAAKGCRVHICHVSAKESIPLIVEGAPTTCEVTAHHLLLDKDAKLGARGKVNPPLRRREDRYALFSALREGAFDVIASDHAPHTIDEKDEDFDYAPSGMPGVETTVPLMLRLATERDLDIAGVIMRVCQRPGEIFGLRKGKIAEGYDADLMVVDFDRTTTITSESLLSKCGWSAFEGVPAIFPKAVFARGEVMMEDGHQVGESKGRDVVVAQRT
ncbi:MAG: dihydroorotase family protein [Thermoplasmata archaeon]